MSPLLIGELAPDQPSFEPSKNVSISKILVFGLKPRCLLFLRSSQNANQSPIGENGEINCSQLRKDPRSHCLLGVMMQLLKMGLWRDWSPALPHCHSNSLKRRHNTPLGVPGVIFKPVGTYSCISLQKKLVEDFRELRATVEKMGLLKPNRAFFLLHLCHILVLDVAAWLTIWYFGSSTMPFLFSALLLGTVQVSSYSQKVSKEKKAKKVPETPNSSPFRLSMGESLVFVKFPKFCLSSGSTEGSGLQYHDMSFLVEQTSCCFLLPTAHQSSPYFQLSSHKVKPCCTSEVSCARAVRNCALAKPPSSHGNI